MSLRTSPSPEGVSGEVMCVCVCMYVFTYIHMYVNTHKTHTHTHLHTNTRASGNSCALIVGALTVGALHSGCTREQRRRCKLI